ncbi:MAG: DUF2382 domain-containing protein [Rhodothermales bacterium]|nr:DUF2382 domain-containing protein [Rhodothermales bacterium]
MAKTIVGVYDDRATAYTVLNELEDAGFGRDHLRFSSHEKGERHNYEIDVEKGADPGVLRDYGVPNDEADFYAEAVRRGGALVVARVHDDDAETAADIMARHAPITYEDRAASYREEGYTGYADTTPYTDEEITEERERYADERTARLKEVEENLKIGKREVVRGGVRVHKWVETGVEEETLRLRDEEVHVDRKNVDRALSPEEADRAFEEKTVEMVERDEEAVVEKEARVTGEVTVGKTTDTREETVGGEVRRTHVEVEETGGTGATGKVEWAEVQPTFKKHYENAYSDLDARYEQYEPAYRYGYDMAYDNRFRNREYAQAEADLRKGYVERHGRDTWDKVKDAVRHGYNSVRARL